MKVKTVRDHENDYGVRDGLPYEKRNGRVYDIDDDAAAQALIDGGYVEAADRPAKGDK